jgi:hypothetical protein
LYVPYELSAQSRSVTLGKEFYVAFGENTETTDVYLKLKVVTRKATVVDVYYGDDIIPVITKSITSSGAYDVVLDKDAIYPDIFVTSEKKAVRVTSTEDIALYALSQGYASAEATAILPIQSLSSSYKALSYYPTSSALLSVVSTKDGTNVTGGGYNGTLDKGWNGLKYGINITDVNVEADNPVAVFVSSKETKIPSGVGDADNLFEQVWPFHSWGKSYIVPVTHRNRDKVRILVKENNTNIVVTGGYDGTLPPLTSLKAGDYVEFDIVSAVQIESDNPIAVNSFMIGNKDTHLASNNKSGDPSQCWINPNEQMTAYTMIAPFYMTAVESQIETHYMIIVTRQKYKNYTTLKRNGYPQSLTFTNPPGIPDYAVAVVSMNNSNNYVYEVENIYGFNAYVYGYGLTESYYFAAGSMVWDLNAYFTVDTIHHLSTSPAINSYPTSGSASIFRNIEGAYTDVKWLINGQDVSSKINDSPAKGVEYHFRLPTDTAQLSGYNLVIDENIITMRVYTSATDYIDYDGKIWIVPPPDPHPDYGFIYGNPSGGGGGGSVTVNIKDNDENIKQGDKLTIKEQPGHGTVEINTYPETTLTYRPNTDFKGVDTIKYCITSEQFDEEICTEVYVVVVFPLVDRYEVCPNTQLDVGLEETPGVVFDWYDGATLIQSSSNTAQVSVDNLGKTFHAVPRLASTGNAIGTIKIPVTVYIKTTGCGSTTEEMCDGSTLFFDDFSGDDAADAGFADTPLSAIYKLPYAFIQTKPGASDYRKYAVAKTYDAVDDHTYPSDTDKGRMLIANGGTSQDTVLQIPVGSLCASMNYSFSAWIRNLDPSSTLIPNIAFTLVDTVRNDVKYTFSAKVGVTWGQYGFKYTPTGNLSNLKLLIINYPSGTGSGNLYAIDDVKIALCAPDAAVTVSEDTICTKESTTFSGTFSGSAYDIGGSYYISTIHLWQFSPDNQNWTGITYTKKSYYETQNSYYTLSNAKISNSGYYRVVVGTNNSINSYSMTVTSPNCVVYSNAVYLHVEPCFSLTDDRSSTYRATPKTVDVLANDIYPCDNPELLIVSTTANGTAEFVGNQIKYTPVGDFVGFDTVKYSVDCDGTVKEAYLYVVVVGTKEPSYSTCPGIVLTLEMLPLTDVTYDWYASSYDYSPVPGGASSNSIEITAPSYDKDYYLQPYYKGTAVGDRIAIKVSIQSSCGSSNEACEGTVIFKEDFGGNSVDDPNPGSSIAAPSTTGFTYKANNDITTGEYSISKYLNRYNYYATDDHTYESTSERGYFMFANAGNSALTYYERTVDIELCDDVEMSVNAWIKNVYMYSGQYPNVRFVITDNNKDTLANYQTGNITGNTWQQYGVKINVPKSTTQLKLSLSNAVITSGTGNDLAIDDIDVRICTDAAISVASPGGVCENSDYTFNATYTLDKLESLYGAGNVIFKWQRSTTGNINNPADWTDIAGATSDSYALTEANTSHDGYYRLLAGDAATIDKPDCRIASNPVELKVLLLPVPVITGNSITCSDEYANLTVSGGVSYYWHHNNSTSASISYQPTDDTELVVTVTGSNGCSINDTIDIEYVAALTLTKTNDTVICQGQYVELTAFSEGADISYLWSTGETTSSITVAPTVSQYYSIKVSNPKNCETEDRIYVEVSELPTVVIDGKSDICLNETVQLIASGALTYEWNTGETGASIFVSPQATTIYTVTGKNEHGCPSTASHSVNVNPLPVPVIAGNTEICHGDEVVLTASGGVSYEWEHDLSTSNAITVAPETDTQYTVTVTDNNGCVADASATVVVNGLPAFGTNRDTVICPGSSIVLQTNGEDTDGYTYLWSTGETTSSITVAPTVSQYYYVEVNNPKNCSTKDSIYVRIAESPAVVIIGESDICLNDVVQLTASGALTYEWNTGETGASIFVSPHIPTIYAVTGKNEYGCPSTANYGITNVKPLPVPLIAGNEEICYGDEVVLTASGGVSYEWKHDLSTSNEITVAPKADTRYTVTVTGSNGCVAETSITVVVNGLPAFGKNRDTIICPGNSVVLQINGGDGYTYLWSTGETTSAITVAPIASQYYYVEVNNPKHCTTKDSIHVIMAASPTVVITGESDICLKDVVQLTASGALTYEWNTGETGASIFVSPHTPTMYTVTGKTEHGCPAIVNHGITNVRPLPTPLIVADKTEICYGDEVVLAASGGVSYEWQHDLSTSDEITVIPETSTQYTVRVTGSNACSADTSVMIKVNSLPALTVTPDTSICTGNSVTLAVQSDRTVNYEWSTGASTSSITISPMASETYYISATDLKQCVSLDSVHVEVNALPDVAIIGKSEICAGETVKLTATGADIYKWNTEETEDSIFVSPEWWPVTYSITGTDSHGCQATASFEITNVKPLPTPDISGKLEICYGESIVLKASGGSAYKWAHNSSPIDSITVEPVKDTTFTVTVTGANGCSTDKSATIKVNSLPVIAPIADTVICLGQSVILRAISAGMGLTYLWSAGEQSNVIELHPEESQDVWVEVTNLKKCSVKEDVKIEVLPPPVLNIIGSSEVCAGSELTLTVFGAERYIWNTGFEGDIYVTRPAGNSEYTVTGIDEYGCKSTATTGITILDKPKVAVNINPKTVSSKEPEVQFETVTDIEDYSVIWDFGDNAWSMLPSIDHRYDISKSDSLYNVVFSITDGNGCVDTIRETVYVDIYTPNLFFPDIGQVFMRNCDLCEKIEIFDRLGVKLYEGPAGWDGMHNGQIVDPDTYFYVITLKFTVLGRTVHKGYITVGRNKN